MRFFDFKPTTIPRGQLAAVHEAIDPGSPDGWVELAELAYMALATAPTLAKHTDIDAAELAVAVVYQLVHHMGGEHIYIANGHVRLSSRDGMSMVERNRLIHAAFSGDNYRDLARQFKLSPMRIRQIIDGHR